MRTRLLAALVVVLTAALLATTPVVADAAKLITGKDIKDSSVTGADIKKDSLTGADIKESSLGKVPSAAKAGRATLAQGLAPLASGETQSGAFSAASGSTAGVSGYIGFGITYPRPLDVPIDDNNIIDTDTNPDPAKCPGAGQAAPGYLCLYFYDHSSVDYVYGWSEGGPYGELPDSVGVGMYAQITGEQPYVDGIWTVTAP
jgi:hypothetical protein